MKTISISQLQAIPITLEYIHAILVRPNLEVTDYSYPPMPFGHFVYALNGYANYICNGQIIELYPKTLAYIPTDVAAYFNENSDFEYIKIYFKITEQASGEEIRLSDTPKIIFNETPSHLFQKINNLCTYYTSNAASFLGHCSMFFSILNNIYYALNQSNVSNHSVTLSITPALLYIKNNYQYQYTSKFLADMCGLSEPYFRKKFKEYTHCTPTEYKLFLQINDACRLLINPMNPVKDIAHAIGFNSTQYFYKTFTKIIGVSPTQYRKHLRDYYSTGHTDHS